MKAAALEKQAQYAKAAADLQQKDAAQAVQKLIAREEAIKARVAKLGVETPDIDKHARMLQELLYFEQAIHGDSDWMYKGLDPFIKAAAIEFAHNPLSNFILCNANWHSYDTVSNEHSVLQVINTIACRQKVLLNMDDTLKNAMDDTSSDASDNENEQPWDEWLVEQRDICREYGEALKKAQLKDA
jgi:hypothetical protein